MYYYNYRTATTINNYIYEQLYLWTTVFMNISGLQSDHVRIYSKLYIKM